MLQKYVEPDRNPAQCGFTWKRDTDQAIPKVVKIIYTA